MTFPTAQSHDRDLPATEGRASDVVVSPPLVCVVDFDEHLRGRLGVVLRTLDIEVEVFPSAEEFLASTQRGRADCVIAEVQLPGISGIELLLRLQDAGPDCPVIFITNEKDISLAVKAIRLGAFDFIEKPFRNRVILDRVLQALRLV